MAVAEFIVFSEVIENTTEGEKTFVRDFCERVMICADVRGATRSSAGLPRSLPFILGGQDCQTEVPGEKNFRAHTITNKIFT